jgi:integrase
MGTKQSKGTVTIENAEGRLRLRWRHKGVRYSLSTGLSFNKVNYKAAKLIANRIELDIAADNFDLTLKRYGKIEKAVEKSKEVTNTTQLWLMWVESLHLSERTLNGHYRAIGAAIAKHNPSLTDAKWLTTVDWCASTYNNHLGYVKRCFDWATAEGLVEVNPYAKLKRRKVTQKRIKPFTKAEMELIITALCTDRCNSKYSAYSHSVYADYVEFLFLSGCRPSEAIGLQHKHIDFDRNELVICESLSRGNNGQSNSSGRVRKDTKTHNIRILSLTDRLRHLLLRRCEGLSSDDLVFTSPTGNPIDDRSFNRRIWKPLLAQLEIEYRRPYISRHTFASTAIELGVPLTSVAYLLGHSDTTMVSRVYAHIVNRPLTPNILD